MSLSARHHQIIRFGALLVTAASVTYMANRAPMHADLTAEGLSQITPGTGEVIRNIGVDRPVTVHAFVSKDVPREYVTVRSRLLNILREMQARGGEGLQVRIVEPEPHSPEAEEAMETFGIMPRPLADRRGGRVQQMDVFMGLAFVSGPREEVVAFIDRGLSPEYEVARALRVVTQEKKKVVGVMRTDATIMGNFDMQSRSQQPAWRIVDELRKQYEVRSLAPKTPVPDDVDVLLVPQLPSLEQDELDIVRSYVDAGRPALLTVDPFPMFDPRLSPTEPKLPPPGQQGGMMGGGPPPGNKGDYRGFLRDVGVEWDDTRVVFDTYNPNPIFDQAPEQIVFVSERPDGTKPFENADPAVDGLEQVVLLYPGALQPAAGYQDKFSPLLITGKTAGFNEFDDLVQKHPLFGIQGPIPPRQRSPIVDQNVVLAARVNREGGGGEDAPPPRNVAVIADLDLFGNLFFVMRERGGDVDGDGLVDVRFDNVAFLLNLVDSLAGDDRFIELRKRKAAFRRLTTVDGLTKDARAERQAAFEKANQNAEAELEEAKKSLEAAVASVRERQELDDTTKAIMLQSAEQAENRRLQQRTEAIEREKAKTIAKVERKHQQAVSEVQNRIRLISVLAPPIPALLLGGFIFARKRRRERELIPRSRSASGAAGGKGPSGTTPSSEVASAKPDSSSQKGDA
jgi:ABC-2 type transport system permease protein